MSDVPIVSASSSQSGLVNTMPAEIANTDTSSQSTSQPSPGPVAPSGRERSPRVHPSTSGVVDIMRQRVRGIGVSDDNGPRIQIHNQEFVDESRNLRHSQQFVDARQVQFQIGVDPAVHQSTIDSLKEVAGARHHQILRDEVAFAESRHRDILQDEMSLAQARHNEILQSEVGQAQARHQQVIMESKGSAQAFVDKAMHDMKLQYQQMASKYDHLVSNMKAQHEHAIRNLQIRHAAEIKDLRQSHEQKIDEVLEGYTKMSKDFEALKVERDSLREALGIEPELERQECCVRAPPYTGVGINEPQISQECCVRAPPHMGVVLDETPKFRDLFLGPQAAEAPKLEMPNPPNSYDEVIAALQEQVQSLSHDMKSRSRKKSKEDSSSSDSDSQSSNHDDYKQESKLMRIKAYDKLKIPSIPKSAAELRTWKNTLISQLTSCCRSSERELLAWLAKPLDGEEVSSSEFPVLNRVLGAKILESAKGSRFAVDFQALQERSIRSGVQAPGILFVAKICKRFRLDKEKGMSLSQQHLISLKPQGSEVRDLEIFRDRVEFILSSLETSEYPAEPILRTWIYDCLKNIPKLSLRIDKYRDAQVGSFERSFQFLWQSMSDVIDEAQHDQNTTSVLSTLRAKVDAAPHNANPKEKKDKKEKDKKDKKDKDKKEKDSGNPTVSATPFNPKAKPEAKGKADPKAKPKSDSKGKEKSNNPKIVAGEKGYPCLFYPSGTCRRDPCPYVHDAASAPKAKAKPKASAPSTSVPAAFAVAASLPKASARLFPRFFQAFAAATSLLSSGGLLHEPDPLHVRNGVSSSSGLTLPSDCVPTMPHPLVDASQLEEPSSDAVPFSVFDANQGSTGTVTWLGDTGAGRTIGCIKHVPTDVVRETGNPVSFATGGGKRDGNVSCQVQGEFTGNTECYLLEQSPWALSIGEQVSKGKAFVWLPCSSS